MGEINNAMNDYLGDVERFADFFNGIIIVASSPKLWEERDKYLNDEESGVNYNMCLAFDQIEAEEREKGRQEGIQEGRQEGENLLAALINKLLSTGRDKDIQRVTTDIPFRESLYIQYGLKKSYKV